MTQKFVVPVSDGVLDAHFGHCQQFTIVEVKNKLIMKEYIIDAPPHEPGKLPLFLINEGVTDVIAGGMGQKAIEIFNRNRVNVFVGAPSYSAKALVDGCLSNTLDFAVNYCDH
jgi:predicted Fe-Mo cluster-binding NifX family protein